MKKLSVFRVNNALPVLCLVVALAAAVVAWISAPTANATIAPGLEMKCDTVAGYRLRRCENEEAVCYLTESGVACKFKEGSR